MEVGTLAHGMTARLIIKQGYGGLRDRSRVIEWNDDSTAVRKQFFRMPIRGRNNRFACAQGNRESTGHDLCFLTIWGDVDISCPDLLN
jgi:hypothetical protein